MLVNRIVGLVVTAMMLVMMQLASPQVQARFLTPDTWDPILEGVDINRYAYGNNDPVNKSDPNGHQVEDAADRLRDLSRDKKERDEYYKARAKEVREALAELEKEYQSDDSAMSDGYYNDIKAAYEKRIQTYDSRIGMSDADVDAGARAALGDMAVDLVLGRVGIRTTKELGAAKDFKQMHGETTIKSGNKSSYDHWSQKSTDEILESLKPGKPVPLKVNPADGTIFDGNTRIQILKERGIDVNKLPYVPHQPSPIGPLP
jgi:hypothetical protein